jgi:hypothetical protein
VASVTLFASLPASDNFNRADGSLATGNWTASSGSWDIVSNVARPNGNGSTPDLLYWNADSFADDQYAQFVFQAHGTNDYMGPACRVTSGGNGYGFLQDNNSIRKIVSGVDSSLGTVTATWSVNDVVKMTCVGTTIEIFQNGVSVGSLTDATFTSGSAGVYGYPGTGNRVDDWAAGNVGGSPPTTLKRILDWAAGNVGGSPPTTLKRILLLGVGE